MPTTTNDPASMPTEGVSGQPQNTARRTDAIGAEIPVIVHASRYSAASRGSGKNLPPVHEETRTVIVFPTGAVVRLSASLTAGELVVLTNQQSGSDVICRVANVKAQPGIQNYVNLEFTQRAPGFWGAIMQAERPVERIERSEPSAPPVIAAFPEPAQRAPLSVPASELISAVQAVTQLLGAVPASTDSVRIAPQTDSIPTASASHAPAASPVEAAGSLHDQLRAALESLTQIPAKPAAHSESAPVGLSVTAPVGEPASQAQQVLPAAVQSSPSPVTQTAAIPASTVQTFLQDSPRTAPDEPLKAALTGGTLFSGAPHRAPAVPRQAFTPPSLGEGFAQEPRKSIDLHLRTDGPSTDSKKLLLTIAAGVLLLIVGAAGGAVLFRQSRSATPTQQTAPAPQVALPMTGAQAPVSRTTDQPINNLTERPAGSNRSSDTSKALLPAAVTSAEAPRSDSSFDRPSQTRTDSSNARAAVPAPAQHIVMGNLAAPIAKRSAALGSSEPPPALNGQAENLEGNTLFADTRTSVPPPPSQLGIPAARTIATTVPKLVFSPNAPYPPIARSQNVQGTVVVDALVDTDGRVVAAKAISGPALLQQVAVTTVRTWKYQPAQQNGQPVAVHTQVNVSFRLQ